MKRTIIFYRTKDGNCPVEDFLDSLPGKVVQKITWVLEILENQGMLPATYFKKLVNTEIWECRIQQGSNIYRIFCFFDKGKLIVLANGFQKKTQKTPKAEIEKALKIMEEYEKEK